MKENIEINPAYQSYRNVATHGVFWNVAMAGSNKIVTLIGQVALAWILLPKDMGLAGMATAMAGFAAYLGANSLGDVLVQRGRYKEEASQAFWLSLFLSFSSAVFIALLFPVAVLIGHPELSKMLLLLASLPLFDCLNPLLAAGLKTDLEFKYLAVSGFVGGVTYTACAFAFALAGFGPYSLILPAIPRSLIIFGCMFLRRGWPQVNTPRLHEIVKLVKPALSLASTAFLHGLQTQTPIFCVGLLMDTTETGHFSWGWMVASQAVFLLSVNLRQVLVPIIAKMNGEPIRQVMATLRTVRAITAILIIVCGLQALLAQLLLDKFFPAKWHASGPVITWISMGLAFQGIYICVVAWLNATGKYNKLICVTTIPVILVSSLAYFGTVEHGITGAAIGSALGLMMSSMCVIFFLPFSVLKLQFKELIVPIFISLSAWGTAYFLLSNEKPLIIVALSIMFFGISALTWWWWSEEQVQNIWRNLFMKSENEKDEFIKKPNFFIIGAPKCGTTAMSEYLREHPNVFLSSPKEPFYFDFDLFEKTKMRSKTYKKIFSKVNIHQHKAVGEASTSYLFSKRAVFEILKFNPEAKFVVMLRNPIYLVQSFHSQQVFNGAENILDFEKAWRAEGDRKKGKKIPWFCLDSQGLMYSEWGNLGDQMERLFSIVPRDKVRVIIFDDFIKDTKKTYDELLSFLNIPTDERTEFEKINENKKINYFWIQKNLSFFFHYAFIVRAKFGLVKKFDILPKLISMNSKFTGRNPISDSFLKELKDFYRDDVTKLSKILNRDLSHWVSME